MLIYKPTNHTYISTDQDDQEWISVTSLIKSYEQPFDKLDVAKKTSKNRKSKWYKIPVDEILKVWEEENNRAIEMGNWYHDQREKEVLSCNTITRDNIDLNIYKCTVNENGEKIAPNQNLLEGIYPEHLVYLKSHCICGQADRVEIVGDTVNIYDYKSNKEIKQKSFVSWSGKRTKMLEPLSHLDDCNYNHYALQLSMYMYIILKHNPHLVPGKMVIQHVIFQSSGEDKYGYPIYLRDEKGNPIVKETVQYNVPYMINEVKEILNHKSND